MRRQNTRALLIWFVVGAALSVSAGMFFEHEQPRAEKVKIPRDGVLRTAEAQVGRHPHDALDPTTPLGASIKLRMGAFFERFRERLIVASAVTREGAYIVGSGNLPHSGGIDTAAFAIDQNRDTLVAIWQEEQRLFLFGVDRVDQLPEPLKKIDWVDSERR